MAQSTERRRWRPSGLAMVVIVLLVLCAGIALVLIFSPGRGPAAARAGKTGQAGGWLAAALTSRLFLLSALVTLGSLAGLVLVGGYLWRAGAGQRGRRSSERGEAMIEFVMVLPIGLMFALVMAQSSLLMVGNLCVNYASYCAARSAIVNVPADLSPTEPPNYVTDDPTASAKLRRIHLAAVWAVLPVSCSAKEIQPADAGGLVGGLEGFFDHYRDVSPDQLAKEYRTANPGWIDSDLARKLRYAQDYTEVELSPPEEGEEEDVYEEHEDLQVRVRHTFYLSVPYANRLFAWVAGADGVTLGFAKGEYGIVITTTCRLTNEGVQDWVEAEKFPRPEE